MLIKIFNYLSKLFEEHGFHIYIVGGTSRDYLLKIDPQDYDFATDATPNDIKEFLPNLDTSFEKFGIINTKIFDTHITIATFRKEFEYNDFRHPKKVFFTKNIEEDYKRRDFTINAIYLDKDLKIIDFCGGVNDLKHKIIRFIGDPATRIKEDPLRILRAFRFAKRLGFQIEPNSLKAIEENKHLTSKLNPEKVKMENKKN